MSVRRAILIEPYRPHIAGSTDWLNEQRGWCAREYVQHDDESRTTRVLHTAPTRREVADWLEARRELGLLR